MFLIFCLTHHVSHIMSHTPVRSPDRLHSDLKRADLSHLPNALHASRGVDGGGERGEGGEGRNEEDGGVFVVDGGEGGEEGAVRGDAIFREYEEALQRYEALHLPPSLNCDSGCTYKKEQQQQQQPLAPTVRGEV